MTWRITSAGHVTSPRAGRRETRGQVLRFLVIGTTSVLIDLGVYDLLTNAGLTPSAAKGLSYLAGMLFGFLGNKFWTFGSRAKSLAEPALYVLLYAATLGVNVGINALALLVLGAEAKLPAFLTATGVTTVLNFVGMKWVTFRASNREG